MATIIITVDTGPIPAHDIRVGLVNIINEALSLSMTGSDMPVLSNVIVDELGEPGEWDFIYEGDGQMVIYTGYHYV